MKESDTVTLGGRTFVKFDDGWTVGHDIWMDGQICRAGLNQLTIMSGESTEQFCRRIMETAVMNGQALALLGGLLLPEGVVPKDWTPEIAESTASFIEGLTMPSDKLAVQTLMASMMLGFFVSGLILPMRSRLSSGEDQPAQTEQNDGRGTAIGSESSLA